MIATTSSTHPIARIAFLALATCAVAFTLGAAPAFADTIPELSGDAEKTPRSGVPMPTKVTLDQVATRDDALRIIQEYRQEAYDEGIVDLPEGMTADEYIHGVTWNQDLERIAIQRAIESSASRYLAHTRPDGTSWSTARSNDVTASSEGIAQWFIGDTPSLLANMDYLEWARSHGGISYGMSLWKMEKASYIKNRNEGTNLLSGHYENLIDPRYKSYGVACVAVQGCTQVICVVSPSGKAFDSNEESVGYVGAYDATMSIADSDYYTVELHPYCESGGLEVGGTSQVRFTASSSLKGAEEWAVDPSCATYMASDLSILGIDDNGVVTAKGEGLGQVSVTVGDEVALVKIPVTTEKAAFRLYNPYSGEHFYTLSPAENSNLVAEGWYPEGLGWVAPSESGDPVFRLYNPNAGDHHYTMDAAERDSLAQVGWVYEGEGWNSDADKGQVLYREYNPNEFSCNHNYTTDKAEHDGLVEIGWRDEGTAWYGVALEESSLNDKPWRWAYLQQATW